MTDTGNNSKKTMLMATLITGVLMAALDIAILGPALPEIRKTFGGLDERALSYLYSIYILFNLVGTPIMAKLSDVLGRRMIYLLDIVLFATGSLLVSMAGDFGTLLAGRAIQGFGAGGILPVANAVIGDLYPPEKRGAALGLVGVTFGIAFLLGPLVAGLVLSLASWHWIFLINLPIAMLLVVPAWRNLPHVPHHRTGRFDAGGMILLSLALAGLTLGITEFDPTKPLESFLGLNVWPFLALAVVAGVGVWVVEQRVSHPILPASVFASRQLRLAYLLNVGSGVFQSSLVFMPLMALAHQSGLTSAQSGYLLLPLVLALTIMNPVAGRLVDRRGGRPVLLAGLVVTGLGVALLAATASVLWAFVGASFLVGLGLSVLLGPPLRYVVLHETDSEHRTMAQGVLSIASSIGTMAGGALLGGLIDSFGGTGQAYAWSFWLVAGLALPMFVATLFLHNKSHEEAGTDRP